MGRKSSIKMLSDNQRKLIERLLREDRHTLDEMMYEIRMAFPNEKKPSRSALGRYSQSFDQMIGRMKEQETFARAFVSELGEDVDDKRGMLMVQAVTSLTTHAALNASERDDVEIKEVIQLARAARNTMEARKMGLSERQEIERIAREKLLEEQEANLEKYAAEAGMGAEQVDFWRREVLGVRTNG